MKILPDQARKDEAISLFSPDEAERDLQENGKFNKRNAEVIRKELTRLNRLKTDEGMQAGNPDDEEGKTGDGAEADEGDESDYNSDLN